MNSMSAKAEAQANAFLGESLAVWPGHAAPTPFAARQAFQQAVTSPDCPR